MLTFALSRRCPRRREMPATSTHFNVINSNNSLTSYERTTFQTNHSAKSGRILRTTKMKKKKKPTTTTKKEARRETRKTLKKRAKERTKNKQVATLKNMILTKRATLKQSPTSTRTRERRKQGMKQRPTCWR